MPMRYSKKKVSRPRRRVARRVPRRMPTLSRKYADTHSFKLLAGDTSIVNVNVGGTIVPKANGTTFIGNQQSITGSGGSARYSFTGSFAFNAAQTLQWSQLNTLFDRYKVNGIRIRVIPENNFATVSGGGTVPVMRYTFDYDDNQLPSIGDVWSRRGVERRLDKPFSIYFKPKMLGLVWRTASTQASSPQPCKFLDCAQSDVPLFGLKYGIRDWYCATLQNDLVLRFEITYYVTMKTQIQINKVALLEQTESAPLEGQEEEEIACENKVPAGVTVKVPMLE